MARQRKLGNRVGVSDWQALDTAGDIRRFLKWCILSVRDQSLETRDAIVLGQLGTYLLKALETSSLEERISALETQQNEHQQQ